MIKVALVDDHQLFRKSLVLLLTVFEDITVVYETDNGNDLLAYIETSEIDILLLDLQMPFMDGFEVCKRVKYLDSTIKVLILSQLSSKEAIHQIMEVGADGYITKNTSPELLENAIRNLLNKNYFFDMQLGAVIREAILWENKRTYYTKLTSSVYLTSREIEIVNLASQEKCSKEIADILCISIRTVEKHRKHIMEKTQSKNFIGVILFALKSNIITLENLG
jgi:DNA-binding NarL/FixJ family response regulator